MNLLILELSTDAVGGIVDITSDAGLLGFSGRGAIGRDIAMFFDTDRTRIRRAIEVASRGHTERFAARWRPRDRKPTDVLVEVRRQSDAGEPTLGWILTALEPPGRLYPLEKSGQPRGAKLPRAHCECVVWRARQHRCELWMIKGEAYLRVFSGDDLVREEPSPRIGAYARAEALRAECLGRYGRGPKGASRR